MIDQLFDGVQRADGGASVDIVHAHRCDCLEIERPDEDRQAGKQPAHLLVEQFDAPGDRRLECPVPRQCRSPTPCQQAEGIGQAIQDLMWCQRSGARRSQLDRQWNAVEPAADLGDDLTVVSLQIDPRPGGLGPLDEKPGRVRPFEQCRVERTGVGRQSHRRQTPRELAHHAQHAATRHHDGQIRAPRQQQVDQIADLVGKVLGVVEDEQTGVGAQTPCDGIGDRFVVVGTYMQKVCSHPGNS